MKSKSAYPAAPSRLTGQEKRAFNRIMKCFAPAHWVSADVDLLVQYVRTLTLIEEATEHVRDEGYVVRGAKSMVRNPWASTLRDAEMTLCSLATKLKISPSSRLRKENISTGIKRVKDGKVFGQNSDWRQYQQLPPDDSIPTPDTSWREHQRKPEDDSSH